MTDDNTNTNTTTNLNNTITGDDGPKNDSTQTRKRGNNSNSNSDNEFDDQREADFGDTEFVCDSEGNIILGRSIAKLNSFYMKGGFGKMGSNEAHKKFLDMCKLVKDVAPPPKKKRRLHASSIVCFCLKNTIYIYIFCSLLHALFVLFYFAKRALCVAFELSVGVCVGASVFVFLLVVCVNPFELRSLHFVLSQLHR